MSPLVNIKATTATIGNNDSENNVNIYKTDFTDPLYFAKFIVDCSILWGWFSWILLLVLSDNLIDFEVSEECDQDVQQHKHSNEFESKCEIICSFKNS